jgi:hypothetical protein
MWITKKCLCMTMHMWKVFEEALWFQTNHRSKGIEIKRWTPKCRSYKGVRNFSKRFIVTGTLLSPSNFGAGVKKVRSTYYLKLGGHLISLNVSYRSPHLVLRCKVPFHLERWSPLWPTISTSSLNNPQGSIMIKALPLCSKTSSECTPYTKQLEILLSSMKHSYIFLELWSHENIYNVWFFWTQTWSTWGNKKGSIKMHKWIQLGPLFKLVKTWHPLGNIHTYINLLTSLLVHSWFWWLAKWLKDTKLLHCCHLAFHKCFQFT